MVEEVMDGYNVPKLVADTTVDDEVEEPYKLFANLSTVNFDSSYEDCSIVCVYQETKENASVTKSEMAEEDCFRAADNSVEFPLKCENECERINTVELKINDDYEFEETILHTEEMIKDEDCSGDAMDDEENLEYLNDLEKILEDFETKSTMLRYHADNDKLDSSNEDTENDNNNEQNQKWDNEGQADFDEKMLPDTDICEISYKCTLCVQYIARSIRSFKQHVRCIHIRPKLKCPECYYYSNYKSNMTQHMLIHKNIEGLEKYLCEICGYATYRKDTLDEHLKTHDPNTKRFKCDMCKFSTLRGDSLKRHQISWHRDFFADSPLIKKCKYCSYSNARAFMVRRHENQVHENIKWSCNLCDYQAANVYRMNSHKLKIHGVKTRIGKQRYECDKCKYATHRSDLIEKHKQFHKEKRV